MQATSYPQGKTTTAQHPLDQYGRQDWSAGVIPPSLDDQEAHVSKKRGPSNLPYFHTTKVSM